MIKPKDAIVQQRFQYKKSYGQHFIYDEILLEQLVIAADVQPEEAVLEIGPGSGTLTLQLAKVARQVLAIELDRTLLPVLSQTLGECANVQVVQGDILKLDLQELIASLGNPCRIVANLPYNITKSVLMRLLEARLPVRAIVVMIQREVAEKMLAKAGEDAYGPLTMWVQYFTKPQEVMRISGQHFTPPPKVDSSFMRLTMRDTPAIQVRNEAILFRLMTAAFAMRRKTLQNNLQAGFSLTRETAAALIAHCGLPEMVRAERLTLEEMGALADQLATL